MKSIAFRAVKNSNGYVRSAFVGNVETGTKAPGGWALVIAASLLVLTGSVVLLVLTH